MSLQDKIKENDETKGRSKWIFKYLRADRIEIDMGPYKTKKEAKKHRDEMESFGAICTPPIEVPIDYKLYKGNEEY